MSAAGALVGLLMSSSVLLVLSRIRRLETPALADRIAPFVAPLRHRSTPPLGPIGVLGSLLHSAIPRRRSGSPTRDGLGALVHAAGGACVGVAIATAAIARGSGPVAAVVLGGIGGIVGLLLLDRRAAVRATRHRAAVERQLPTVVDLLALAVAAGETPLEAIARIARIAQGELAAHLRAVVQDVRAGATTERALRDLSDRVRSPEVERFVEALLVALERGTPIVEVLRAQAADVRAGHRRRLMELAGRKDIAMLVPVVFLILPTVIALALFPGFRALEILVP